MKVSVKRVGLVSTALFLVGLFVFGLLPRDSFTVADSQQSGQEIVSLRTENTKTFDLGDNKRRLVVSLSAVHYKDDYADSGETWKDIDLTWDGNKITKAPYELVLDGNKITVTDKKSGKVSTCELISIGDKVIVIKDQTKTKGLVTLKDITTDTDLEIVAESGAVKFTRVLKSDKAQVDATFKVTGDWVVMAMDAKESVIPVTTTLINGILTETLKPRKGVKYPVRIDPTLTVQPSGKDNTIAKASSTTNFGSATWLDLYSVANNLDRILLEFGLTGLPSGASMSAATLSLYVWYLGGCNENIIWAYKQTHTDWVELQSTWNIYKTGSNWATAGGDYVTSDPAGSSTTLPAAINNWTNWDVLAIVQDAQSLGIAAEFLVRLAGEGAGNINPTFRSNNYTTDPTLCPKLVIDYTCLVPTVITNTVSDVEETSTTLSGNITNTNGENCDYRGFEWGTSTANYTSNWTESGNFGVSNFAYVVENLTKGEEYFVRAMAHHSGGWGYGSEVIFLTKPDAPSGLIATAGFKQVGLAWTLGDGADNTIIRGKVGDYPSNYDTDTAVYDDIGSSTNHTGLTNGDHWYYRAWSYCTEGGLEQYSDLYTQADATPDFLPPSDFIAVLDETGTQVILTWVKAGGSENTTIVAKEDSYATNITSGTVIYNGTGENTTYYFGLLALEVVKYYLTAWSQDADGLYSDSYAETIIGGEGMEELTAQVTAFNALWLDMLTLLIVVGLIGLIFWQRSLFLYFLGVPTSMVYGLTLATGAEVNSPLFVAGVIIALIGTYFLFKAVMIGFESNRARRSEK